MALVVVCDRKTMKVKRRYDDGIKKDPDWAGFTRMLADRMTDHYSAEENNPETAGGNHDRANNHI